MAGKKCVVKEKNEIPKSKHTVFIEASLCLIYTRTLLLKELES